MASKTIGGLTADTAPGASDLIETETAAGASRKVLLSDARKRPLGEPIKMAEGSNGTSGLATLAAGTVVVSTNKVTANSRIHLTAQETGTLTGNLRVSARTAATSFTILSSGGTDTATVAWAIIEP